MRVRDIMVEPVVVAPEEATLAEIAETMLARGIGAVPIVGSEGLLVGIVTESDFVGSEQAVPLAFPTRRLPRVFREWIEEDAFERILAEARARPAREIMSAPVVTCDEDDRVQDAVERMIENEIGRLPVVRAGRPIGIVSRHDILKIMVGRSRS